MGIEKTLKNVEKNIAEAAARSNRDRDSIKLIAVSKTVDAARVLEAIHAGASILGENRVQEAQRKIEEIRTAIQDDQAEWHLIGNLQKNKAKHAVKLFDLIHSVDSVPLAEELNRQAQRFNKTQRVLVQIKLSDEETKHGISESNYMDLLKTVKEMSALHLEGLMTVPPFHADPEMVRPYFSRLKRIFDNVNEEGISISELSMGMSNDYEVAIEEGATLVRVGSAIFGERNYHPLRSGE